MEVETRRLSNFDGDSEAPFASYSVHSGADDSKLCSPEYHCSEMSESPESTGFNTPVTVNSGADTMVTGGKLEASKIDFLAASCSDSRPPPTGSQWSEVYESDGAVSPAGGPANCKSSAAMKVQKVYRSYRTRRMLADSAVVAEELWWQAINYARLNYSTVSFFNFSKSETAASRWNRIRLNASKVGKGLSEDAKAQKLAFEHWIEAIDPRHRYGHFLHIYYEEWCKTDAGQPFFYWLDIGDGKDVDLKECPRSKLRQNFIKYLGPQEREHYEYIAVEGKIVHKQSGKFLDTTKGRAGATWIFVMSTSKKLYAGQKKKGTFHHSSFLAGGATLAAGRLEAEDGILKSISPYSGHYRPTDDRMDSLLSFLKENGVELNDVEIHKAKEDYENSEESKSNIEEEASKEEVSLETTGPPQIETQNNFKRTLSGGLQSPRPEVPETAILQRINSKKAASSYQLGTQLSRKWSSGAGPRIGCVADYPVELRLQALEFVNLSPRTPPSPSSFRRLGGLASPTSCPPSDLYNGHLPSAP